MKKLLLHKFEVKFSFYEGCIDYLTVLAKNEKQASEKARKWLSKSMLLNDLSVAAGIARTFVFGN